MTIEYKDSKRIVTTSKSATGGTITTNGTKTVHTFLLAQTGTSFTPNSAFDVEYLVIAGGGGGGGGLGGGGGAGGYRTATGLAVTGQAYTITVGAGGTASGASNSNGGLGGNSIFSTITSTGGGYGTGEAQGSGSAGGSGGGSGTSLSGGASSPVTDPVQGYAGGTTGGNSKSGGGGAGAVGADATGSTHNGGVGGAGGAGRSSSITGTAIFRAGGGGGGSYTGGNSAGGNGGGGAGSWTSSSAGDTNTGSGGGGGGEGGGDNAGSAGGSGIVIISYDTAKPTNVQDNSILIEKDTANRYWLVPESTDAENITWDNATLDSFTDSSGTITLSNTSGGWLAKAQSSQTFTSSTGGETVINISAPASGAYLTFGLGKNPYAGSTPSGNEERDTVNFAFVAYSNYLHIKELGVDKYTVGTTWSASDDFKITMSSSGEVKYYVNDVLEYTSLTTASGTFYTHVTGARDGSSATVSGTITQITPATWNQELPVTEGLKLHLDASRSSTITKDSSNLVSQWNDFSSQGNNISQATSSKQPLFVADVQNGKPVIRFDGSNDMLQRTTYVNGALTQPNTVFYVGKIGGNEDFTFASGTLGSENSVLTTVSKLTMYAGSIYGADNAVTTLQQYTFLYNTTSSTMRVNGTQTDTGSVGTHTMQGFTVGANYTDAQWSAIDVCEILVYNGTLSDTNRDKIESYLMEKWGL
jgi:hypothetical protein